MLSDKALILLYDTVTLVACGFQYL